MGTLSLTQLRVAGISVCIQGSLASHALPSGGSPSRWQILTVTSRALCVTESGVNISSGRPGEKPCGSLSPQPPLPSDGPGAHNDVSSPDLKVYMFNCVLHFFLLGCLVRKSTESRLNPNSCFPAPAAFPAPPHHPPAPILTKLLSLLRPDSCQSFSFSHISYPVHLPIQSLLPSNKSPTDPFLCPFRTWHNWSKQWGPNRTGRGSAPPWSCLGLGCGLPAGLLLPTF